MNYKATQATHAQQATQPSSSTKAATQPGYDPNLLLDTLMHHLGIGSDGALARRLRVAHDVIVSIRRGTLPVCASMLLWMHEATGIGIDELRRIMGDRRAKFRLNFAIRPLTQAA